jgi:hypothetical protein
MKRIYRSKEREELAAVMMQLQLLTRSPSLSPLTTTDVL